MAPLGPPKLPEVPKAALGPPKPPQGAKAAVRQAAKALVFLVPAQMSAQLPKALGFLGPDPRASQEPANSP
jgi:hypothetical protein